MTNDFWSEFRYCYVVRSVSEGRSCFLCVAASGCFGDLHFYFQVGGEVDLVLITDHFIQFEGVTTVVLPGDPETYHRL